MSIRTIVDEACAGIDAGDPAIWIGRVAREAVQARAEEVERSGGDLPLAGLTFAVKDNIDVVRMPTTVGCPAFAYTPAESATVVTRLESAGAILLGKTNLDQFATGLVGVRSPFGVPRADPIHRPTPRRIAAADPEDHRTRARLLGCRLLPRRLRVRSPAAASARRRRRRHAPGSVPGTAPGPR